MTTLYTITRTRDAVGYHKRQWRRCRPRHPYGMPGIRYLGQTLMELGRRVAPTAVILGREPLIAE